MRCNGSIPFALAISGILLSAVCPTAAEAITTRLLLGPVGEASGDFFGQSVSGGGDVNGDGFEDFVVGAPFNDAGGSVAGRAYVYFGGPGADQVADVVLTGEAAQDVFGSSVSIAGDVNGDGYADVIVGAEGNDAGGSDAGRSYLFFGGPGMDSLADVIFTGSTGDGLGEAVSGAGDFNGDGFSDVIVGVPGGSGFGDSPGKAFIYLGGATPDSVADFTLNGEFDADNFGISVSGAGDIDSDGYEDVIVGAANFDSSGFNRGRAYIYFGGPSADAIVDLILTGESGGSFFGSAVSQAGDVNGDGFDDVAVGAPTMTVQSSSQGRVYVFFGGPTVNGGADWILTGENESGLFGTSVSEGVDYNRDGFADLIVGANQIDAGGQQDAGRAYVFFGGSSPDETVDLTFTGEAVDDRFGVSVSTTGDVTGDGFPDLIVGAERNDLGGSTAGRAFVYDVSRYLLLAPNGGETWPVGSQQVISWKGDDPADLWLSSDGGFTYELLRSQVGGSAQNATVILVPHVPTRFALVRLTPSDTSIPGEDQSDSLFSIEMDIALLQFQVEPIVTGGAELTWSTEPAAGPDGISGYRLYRSEPGSHGSDPGTAIGPALITATRYVDAAGTPGSRYRLTAVNGLGQEIELGRAALASRAALTAWPQPYRGGALHVGFAAAAGLGNARGRTELEVFDAAGRRIRTLVHGEFEPGFHTTTWNGLDASGRSVASGIYFLQLRTEGQRRLLKLVVAR